MKFRWLLPKFLQDSGVEGKDHKGTGRQLPYVLVLTFSFLLAALPAYATKLQSWRFDNNQNRLEFTTDEGVQPKAQLLLNPTRLVIDLPGTTLGRSAVTQTVGGSIRSIRVAQFNGDTTRMVVELAPDYTLDPQQVKFRGIAPNQWTVQLPTPQRVAQSPGDVTVPTEPDSPSDSAQTPAPSTAATQVQSVRVTPDGVFVRTSGAAPRTTVGRSNDRRQITIDLQGSAIAPNLRTRDILVNRFGVSRLQVSQLQASPPVTRLTLNVQTNSPDWQATTSSLGGVVLLPTEGVASNPPANNPPSSAGDTPTRPPVTQQTATIQSVDLEENGNRLVIQANQSVTYTSGWDRSTGAYRILVSPAQLADNVRGPKLGAGSPVLRVRLRQEDSRTVAILVQPAAGVRVGSVSQPSQQLLSLQLQSTRPAPGNSGNNPVPPVQNPPSTPLPRVPNGRIVVIVDPGHGGPDPGAVGIGGLQEKDIVMDISRQVASLLEGQGVQAVLTRSADIDLDLEPRVQMAERLNATVFVSIHANSISLSRPDVSGIETYYYNSGDRLARVIHSNIIQGTGAKDRGVRQARFYVLRKTSMPAVLIEVGFVTGREDAARLSTSAYRSQMAAAIVRGILQYIQQSS